MYELLQVSQKFNAVIVAFSKAGVCTVLQTGPRAGLDEQRVVVTVLQNLHYFEKIAAFLPLGPEPFAGPAEEGDEFFGNGFLVSFFVHEPQHQHLVCGGVLNDGWHQPVFLGKI